MMGSKAFESPLISHVRMRGLYRGLVETRLLTERLGKRQGLRLGSRQGVPAGLEACWVATVLGSDHGDLLSDARGNGLVEYVRAIGQRDGARGATAGELRTLLSQDPKPFAGTAMERMMYAAGAARAMRTCESKSVVLAFAEGPALDAAAWKRLLAILGEGHLPLVIVTVPGRSASSIDLAGLARQTARRSGASAVPVLGVDAGDAVALYRVAQEAIGRARADRDAAVLQCIAFGLDPIRTMAKQLVGKKICTERWVNAVAPGFRALLADL